MKKSLDIKWRKNPSAHDYPAAEAFLSLHFETKIARKYVRRLKSAGITRHKAIDLFRASGLPRSDESLDDDKKAIRHGKKISPILMVRDVAHGRLIIADGYHRLCAVYAINEDALIHCKLV